MRFVYLVECIYLRYVCEVCSSFKTARLAQRWYHEVIGKGQHVYQITSKILMDSCFKSCFEIPKD